MSQQRTPSRLPGGLGGGSRTRILEALTDTPGSVRDLAERLGLSYMGVKAQCLVLASAGLLESSLRRKARGRPEIIYRPGGNSRKIFQGGELELALSLLDQAGKMFGPQAPRKLLFQHFRAAAAEWERKVADKDPRARMKEVAALRAACGHFSRFEPGPPPQIVESHHPLAPIFEKYPESVMYETDALTLVVGRPLKREIVRDGEIHFTLQVG